MNTLRGELVTRSGGTTFVGDTLSTDVSAYPLPPPPPMAARWSSGCGRSRSAWPTVGDATPHTGRLTLIEPLGPQKIVWFTVGDVLLSAIADDQWQGTVGHAIAFGFDLPRASMFDAKSEARL